jgi:hypothetical protein
MTQVTDIIQAALRESNVIAAGQVLTSDQTSEALDRLQSLVLSSLGDEIGYIMEDWNISNASYVKPTGVPIPNAAMAGFAVEPNSRLLFNLTGILTIVLDPQPQDGQRVSVVDAASNFAAHNLTLNPSGRKINGSNANLVLSTSGVSLQWVYRSDLGAWVEIDPLVLASEMPFPKEFDDYFIILLAMRLNPRFGRTLDQQSQVRFQQQTLQFVNRYTQSRLRSLPTPAADNPARAPQGGNQ